MPYYGDASPYYYGGPFSNHSSLMTGIARTIHSPLGSSRYAPHLSTISESPLSALRRYSPAATISSRPKRVIDTADIDVSTPRALPQSTAAHQRNRLRRDRPTIRIRSQALKDNPALREHYERHEKTVGELLVEKFLIKDKKKDGDGELLSKLHAQVSPDNEERNEERDEFREAIKRRVTRRMTRRRSSADVQMDPERLEREVLIAQAQADALDTLVAEEQAEIETETRMGTLVRKNLPRSGPSVLGKHENQSGNDDDDDARTKKISKKIKKRKKVTEKPSPPDETELDSEIDGRNEKSSMNETAITIDDNGIVDADGNDDESGSKKSSKFKVEASNSVGDFSTLWINAGAAEESEKKRKNSRAMIEQFRHSVRLPAPKTVGKTDNDKTTVEEHQQVVVLPVRKRYVKDDSRNSVYLTLKTQRNVGAGSSNVDTVDNVNDDRRSTKTLSNGGQVRSKKVAKFRSKDIAESDVEVKSISAVSERGEGPGELWTKETGFEDPSTVSVTIDEVAKKSSSSSDDKNRVFAVNEDLAVRREDPKTRNAIFGTRTENGIGDSKNEIRVVGIDDGTTDDGATKVGVGQNGEKAPDVGKKAKNAEINGNGDRTDDELTRKIKPGGLKSFDEKFAVCSANEKIDESPDSAEKSKIDGKISSLIPSRSVIVESLPSARAINSTDAAKRGTDRALKSRVTSPDDSSCGNSKIVAGTNGSNDDSTGSEKISMKFGKSGIPKANVADEAATEVNGLADSTKIDSKRGSETVEEPTVDSPKIPTSEKKENFFKFDERSEIDGKNVGDVTKVRNKRKNLGKSPKSIADDDKEIRPESPDLKVTPDGAKKSGPQLKKRVVSATNADKSPQSSPKTPDSTVDGKKKLRKDREIVKTSDGESTSISTKVVAPSSTTNGDAPKLSNGLKKLKLKPIEEIRENRELAKAENSKPKIPSKPETPPVQENDGIDFWSEIESQRIAKPAIDLFIAEKFATETNGKIFIADADANGLKPEEKQNPPAKSGAGVAPKGGDSIAGGEKEPEKITKKKTTESEGGKKKDQEKASGETISERFISGDGGDEKNSKEQKQRQHELCEKSSEPDASGSKSCESHETDRFERNLSTIAEEISPVTEEFPKIPDLASLIFRAQNETAETKADVEKLSITENFDKTASPSVPDTSEPEVTVAVEATSAGNGVDATETRRADETVARESVATFSTKSGVSVPIINIEEAPPPEPEDEETVEDRLEEIVEEPEQEDGPGTPTNETTDATSPNNISKWTARADLSLDEPDKDVGREVIAVGTKKDSGKKKKSTKKGSGKKFSKDSVGSNSPTSPGASPDSSKKKKLGRRKKSSMKSVKDGDKRTIFEERSESKISNSSDTTLKSGGLNLRTSPKNSPRNTPKQRPLDLIKMFYTTPASLLTATPRDLSKVRRAKIKKKKHSTRTASASSDSTGSTRSTQSTGTAESTGSTEHEDDVEQKRISSTRSNDSGFDGSPRLSNCDMACHKKCEKLTGNLCGLNQKLVAEALQALKRAPSQSSDNQRNSDGSDHHGSGRITPPATNLPRFKKYTVMDFNFLKVLGKGSFGKVLLAELRRTDCVYAVKCLKKDVVLEDDDVECTLIERKVLTLATRHPYLCHLFCTFQTDSHLFFVMEYLNGGDLMFHIQKSGRFAESRARFYAAEIWSGLNFLHKKGIVYRDLKLDNVLLDFEGHIRIADFGMCKLQIFLDRTADTFCGTPDYMAPEIIKGLKYNQAVDWWSFGVLLYEMLTGQSPFSGCDEDELFWSICNERPFIPRYLSQEAMDVLVCLLEKDAGKRPMAHDIAGHPFFHSTQWDRLERRQLQPPFKPALEHTLDTRYFDTAFTAERPRLTPVPEQILTSMDQGVFRGFSYTNPNATD